jgi:hypothetical protein
MFGGARPIVPRAFEPGFSLRFEASLFAVKLSP